MFGLFGQSKRDRVASVLKQKKIAEAHEQIRINKIRHYGKPGLAGWENAYVYGFGRIGFDKEQKCKDK